MPETPAAPIRLVCQEVRRKEGNAPRVEFRPRHNLDLRRADTSTDLDGWGRRFMFKQGLSKQDRWPDRRAFVALIPGAAFTLAGCVTRPAQPVYYGRPRSLSPM